MDQARILQLLLYIHLWVVSTDKSTIQKYLVVTAFIEKEASSLAKGFARNPWLAKMKKKRKKEGGGGGECPNFWGVSMVII